MKTLLSTALAYILITLGAQAMSEEKTTKLETASFGGGCFWCTEAFFEHLDGVKEVVSGYQGGKIEHPSYKQICTGRTGHAEVIRIKFDPEVVSYQKLLEHFFKVHDPTTLNRQGNDKGTQYRSVVFPYSDEQKRLAKAKIEQLNRDKVFAPGKVVTTIEPLAPFYEAELYHQDYYKKNPDAGYCRFIIAPKLKKLGLD